MDLKNAITYGLPFKKGNDVTALSNMGVEKIYNRKDDGL